jgi:prephenate dehydrogenase
VSEPAPESLHFHTAAVIGVGLIGGSLALALRNKKMVDTLIGVGRSRENLVDAERLGIIDSYTHSPEEAVEKAQLVILATPVRAIPPIISRIKDHLKPGTLITDVASTKARLIQEIDYLFPVNVDFVPAHPIAGKEKSGARSSDAALFKDRWIIITPSQRTRSEAMEKVKKMWNSLGAKVEIMEPDRHDKILAAISHLPHMIAYALVDTIVKLDEKEPIIRFSAGGFHEFIRIAGSSPEMWRDICLENPGPINEMIGLYMARLQRIGNLVENGDATDLLELFTKSREVKEEVEN